MCARAIFRSVWHLRLPHCSPSSRCRIDAAGGHGIAWLATVTQRNGVPLGYDLGMEGFFGGLFGSRLCSLAFTSEPLPRQKKKPKIEFGVCDALVEGKGGAFMSVIVHSVHHNISVPHIAAPRNLFGCDVRPRLAWLFPARPSRTALC